MSLALGIDTGGTYTDGVILEIETKKILAKAKSFTTREDLSLGIRGCMENMSELYLPKIELVALSTTLATNSIVEGRGCRVGLILIGHESMGDLPAQEVLIVAGGHDIKGNPVAELDIVALQRAVRDMRGKVDTLAISGYLSVRNPEHELQALQEIKHLWEIPVVCSHQLTTVLGFHERTVTACLNARLLPVIQELLTSVKRVLVEKNIKAPIMVVKGDGTLMSEEATREKPIQTILSGPAASVVGATFLTGQPSALVLDMGGTTTDIAILDQGRPGLNSEGAIVGGWKTRVEAAEISTFGIGGDSYIQIARDGRMSVGPRRVWSLAATAEHHPNLVEELANLTAASEVIGYQPVDCWMLVKQPTNADQWSDREWKVIRALEDGPHNIFVIAERTGQDASLLPIAQLEQAQVVGRISLTPTDLLHVSGKFTQWCKEAAVAAAKIQSQRMHMNLNDFLEMALKEVHNVLTRSILQSLIYRQGLSLNISSDAGAAVFLNRFLGEVRSGFGVELNLDFPIVAIGAPVSSYIPKIGEAFHTKVMIPEHAEVANAVGAAVAQVVETVRVLIKPSAEGGFIVYSPWEREAFLHLEEAEQYAVEKAQKIARLNAVKAGAGNLEVAINKEEAVAHTSVTDDDLFVEMRIEVTATGRPNWGALAG